MSTHVKGQNENSMLNLWTFVLFNVTNPSFNVTNPSLVQGTNLVGTIKLFFVEITRNEGQINKIIKFSKLRHLRLISLPVFKNLLFFSIFKIVKPIILFIYFSLHLSLLT